MDTVRQSLAIALVFGLLWAALWLLRRKGALRIPYRGGAFPPHLLQSRARLALSPHHSIHWVRAGDREFVLAVHPAGVTLLRDCKPGSPPQESRLA